MTILACLLMFRLGEALAQDYVLPTIGELK